tara:strand:- start:21884 stop:22276 length:393 start_codon:yes stop_codon:yes gene_type:complete
LFPQSVNHSLDLPRPSFRGAAVAAQIFSGIPLAAVLLPQQPVSHELTVANFFDDFLRHAVIVASPLLNASIAIDLLNHAPPPVFVEGATFSVAPSLFRDEQSDRQPAVTAWMSSLRIGILQHLQITEQVK